MKNLNQLLLEFNFKQNFKDDDFYVGPSNYYTFELMNKWPKWDKKFLNIIGEKHSGKTHLINIFLKKFKGIKISSNLLNNDNLKKIKSHQNIILEDVDLRINEELTYTLFNICNVYNKWSLESLHVIGFCFRHAKRAGRFFGSISLEFRRSPGNSMTSHGNPQDFPGIP